MWFMTSSDSVGRRFEKRRASIFSWTEAKSGKVVKTHRSMTRRGMMEKSVLQLRLAA
jgi:hypothetical protein